MTADEFRDLIVAAGPLDDEIQAISALTEDTLLVSFPEIDVEIEHDPAHEQAIFTAPLGRLPEGRAAAIHRFLLLGNALLRDTGGVVAALTGEGDEAVLMVPIPLARLTPAAVATVATNLGQRAAATAAALAAGLAEDDAAVPAPGTDDILLRL